jgi:hypothetical protein
MHSKAARLAISSVVASLFVFGVLTTIPQARAVTAIVCLDMTQGGLDVTDIAPANINDTLNCTAATTHLGIVASEITAVSPTGTETSLNSESGVLSNTINSGDFQVNEAGVWEVRADFFDENGVRTDTELINIAVSFLVIPESPIGIIALVGSSLAAMAGFMVLRSRSQSIATPTT